MQPVAKRLVVAGIAFVARAGLRQSELGLGDDLASRPWNDARYARSMIELLERYPDRVRMAAGRRIDRLAVEMKIGGLSG